LRLVYYFAGREIVMSARALDGAALKLAMGIAFMRWLVLFLAYTHRSTNNRQWLNRAVSVIGAAYATLPLAVVGKTADRRKDW
jgi:hypothetical protein